VIDVTGVTDVKDFSLYATAQKLLEELGKFFSGFYKLLPKANNSTRSTIRFFNTLKTMLELR